MDIRIPPLSPSSPPSVQEILNPFWVRSQPYQYCMSGPIESHVIRVTPPHPTSFHNYSIWTFKQLPSPYISADRAFASNVGNMLRGSEKYRAHAILKGWHYWDPGLLLFTTHLKLSYYSPHPTPVFLFICFCRRLKMEGVRSVFLLFYKTNIAKNNTTYIINSNQRYLVLLLQSVS